MMTSCSTRNASAVSIERAAGDDVIVGGVEYLLLEPKRMVSIPWATGGSAIGAPRNMSAATHDEGAQSADIALARRVIAGEPSAQREVWDRYAPMVHGVLRRALGAEHDFDDLLQDVFLRVFDRVVGLRELGALRSFIYSVTIRVVRWEIRRAQSRRRQAAALLHHDGSGVVTVDHETRDLLARVEAVLAGMPQKERAVFVLVHVEGQALAEIAEGLGISLSTAKRWLKRGVHRIEARIDEDAQLAILLQGKGRAPR
jgi:RNA polymerase sigma-70 factor (ECF subfamily)